MAKGKTPMTQSAASRIQSHNARSSGGKVAKGGFTARAARAAAQNAARVPGKK